MDENKAWAIYKALDAVLKQLDSTITPQLYANVEAAVSSAKGYLESVLSAE